MNILLQIYRLHRDDSCSSPTTRGLYKRTYELSGDKGFCRSEKICEINDFQSEQLNIGNNYQDFSANGQFILSENNYLTSDTLKKLRRHKSESVKSRTNQLVNKFGSSLIIFTEDDSFVSENTFNDGIRRDQLKKLDIYQSSPCLLNTSFSSYSNIQNNHLRQKCSTSAVQYTGTNRNKIGFNF